MRRDLRACACRAPPEHSSRCRLQGDGKSTFKWGGVWTCSIVDLDAGRGTMHTWGRGGWRGVLGWVGRVLGGVHSLTLWYSVPASRIAHEPYGRPVFSRFRHVSSSTKHDEAGAKPHEGPRAAQSRVAGAKPRQAALYRAEWATPKVDATAIGGAGGSGDGGGDGGHVNCLHIGS